MTCRFGHTHPPASVTQSLRPAMRPTRLHCVNCKHAAHPRSVAREWVTVTDLQIILWLMRAEPLCRFCFPTVGAANARSGSGAS